MPKTGIAMVPADVIREANARRGWWSRAFAIVSDIVSIVLGLRLRRDDRTGALPHPSLG